MAGTAPASSVASIDVATIRQRFNYEWTVDPDSFPDTDTYWWWACSIRTNSGGFSSPSPSVQPALGSRPQLSEVWFD